MKGEELDNDDYVAEVHHLSIFSVSFVSLCRS